MARVLHYGSPGAISRLGRWAYDNAKNVHEVVIKVGKFIIVNSCNPEAGDTDHNVTSSGLHPGFHGIHIMTLCKTGRFRTKSEWLVLINRLCSKVAFKLNQVFDTGDGPTLFELLKCD